MRARRTLAVAAAVGSAAGAVLLSRRAAESCSRTVAAISSPSGASRSGRVSKRYLSR